MVSLQSLGLPEQEPPVERVDVPQPLQLATSRYQNWREGNEYLPVGITTGRPRSDSSSASAVRPLAASDACPETAPVARGLPSPESLRSRSSSEAVGPHLIA